jgi:hypothetical protein
MHEEVRFAAPAELARCLLWGLVCILCVSRVNTVQELLSLGAYIKWTDAILGKRVFLHIFAILIPFHSARLSSDL